MLITLNIKVYTGIISQLCPHYIKNTNTQIKVIVDWTIEELNEGVEKDLQQPHNFHVTIVPVSQDALIKIHILCAKVIKFKYKILPQCLPSTST